MKGPDFNAKLGRLRSELESQDGQEHPAPRQLLPRFVLGLLNRFLLWTAGAFLVQIIAVPLLNAFTVGADLLKTLYAPSEKITEWVATGTGIGGFSRIPQFIVAIFLVSLGMGVIGGVIYLVRYIRRLEH